VVRLRLEDGEELPFNVDTGSALTMLDKSLEPKLGRRIGERPNLFLFDSTAGTHGIYRAPKLYIGNTQLLTGPRVVTAELHFLSGQPCKGILGMDCLGHYCIQLDFAARKMRFLDPDHLNTEDLGKPFPITTQDEERLQKETEFQTVFDADLFGQGNARFVLDTGANVPFDAMLEPKLYQLLLHEQKPGETNLSMTVSDGRWAPGASFPCVDLCGQTYADLRVSTIDIRPKRIKGLICLRFVARHLATFNFPKGTIYLKRISSGPLTGSPAPR